MKIPRLAALVAATALLVACRDELPPTEQYVTFKGVVLDSVTSKPVANATVTVDTVLSTTTANDGTFSIANVPNGEVDYVVSVEGYQTVAAHVHADPLSTATVTVKLAPATAGRPLSKWKFSPKLLSRTTRAARSHAR